MPLHKGLASNYGQRGGVLKTTISGLNFVNGTVGLIDDVVKGGVSNSSFAFELINNTIDQIETSTGIINEVEKP